MSSTLNPEATTWGSWNETPAQSQPQAQIQAQTQSQQNQPNAENSGRGRRNRAAGGSTRGRGRGGQRTQGQRAGSQANQSNQPTQPAEQQQQQQQQQRPVQQQADRLEPGQVPNGRNSRGGARGRGTRGRGGRGGASIVPQRAFGAQLSSAEPVAEPSAEPSSRRRQQQQPTDGTRIRNRRRNRGGPADDASVADTEVTTGETPRLPPSTAADLTTRIHEDIDSGNYDCPICLNAVTRRTRVWSCSMCFHVAHYSCVSSWVKKALEQGLALDKIRCPACNSQDTNSDSESSQWSTFSQKKLCWCGKQKTAGVAPAALPPHSCGRICGRQRSGQNGTSSCDHTCPSMCHAGPCPPCTEMGPMMACFCGKQTSIKECALSSGAGVSWSCGEPCGQLMPCGEHRCERACHADDCGPCKVPLPSTCYCGKVEKELLCRERQSPKTSWSTSSEKEFEGTFDCKQACGRAFDCGTHFCAKACHPQDAVPAHCPTSVDVVTHCLCGKTHLCLINAKERTFCADPVPSCGKTCGKQLPGCDHVCQEPCHDAAKPCPPCKQIVNDTCACETTTHQVVCGDADARDAAQCDTVCRASFNCKQHRCAAVCCSGKPKAARRIALTKRKSPQTQVEYEAEHMCVRPCGRALRCGRHACPQVCHKGACHSCVAYLHEDLSCPCGRTAVEPPYLCGTVLPRCDYDCPRPLPCGHPAVPHRCHDTANQPCPRCQRLVSKSCLCGKLVLQKVACGADNIQCNSICGATLKCGVHKCRLGCHAPGRCEDADTEGCSQVCGRLKSICGHGCTEPCHGAESKCNETELCGGAVEIHCACGRISKRVRCNAVETEPAGEATDADAETESTTETQAEPDKKETRVLECDDECLRIKRNLALRDALRISDDYKDEHMAYTNAQMEYFMANRVFASAQELALREFVADTAASIKLKPMKRHERQFVHTLAETLGLRTEARDEEPHRYVIVMRLSEVSATTKIPELTLSESEEIYKRLKERAAEDAALAASEVLKEQAIAASQKQKEADRQKETGKQRMALPPFNAIYVPAAGTSPLACDAFQAILEAWQQTLDERAGDTATLSERMIDGDFVLRVDMHGRLEQFLLFVLSYLVDPSVPASAHLCHVDDQWNVLRRATSDSDADEATSQWNVVAGRTERGVLTSEPASAYASSAYASASASASGSSTPPKRIFTLRKKVVTTVRNTSSSVPSAAFKSEADRRRWMDILAAQPTDGEVEVEVAEPVEIVEAVKAELAAVDTTEPIEVEQAESVEEEAEPETTIETTVVNADTTKPVEAEEAEPEAVVEAAAVEIATTEPVEPSTQV